MKKIPVEGRRKGEELIGFKKLTQVITFRKILKLTRFTLYLFKLT